MASLASGVYAYRVSYRSTTFDHPFTNVQSTVNGGLYKGPVTHNGIVYQYIIERKKLTII